MKQINPHSGFRIAKLEVFNWGTFDHKVLSLSFEGENALLTGDNGSGKSTLVDALLTLLVANRKRNYNLASGSERRERTEHTYVRGAYGRGQNEFNQGEIRHLRGEDQFSVLIAQFTNQATDGVISLAQFFWFEKSELRKFYVVSHKDLNVVKHFSSFKTPSELRSKLKSETTTEIFSSFTEYENYFIKFVGLRSTKALDLFNQITTIKEVGRLNDFVRTHMLDVPQTDEHLTALHANYQNLTLAYQSIVAAKKQLAELVPIALAAGSYQELEIEKIALEKISENIPGYFDSLKSHVLQNLLQIKSLNCTRKEDLLKNVKTQEQGLSAEIKELELVVNQDDAGQATQRLDLLIKQLESQKSEKETLQQKYESLCQALDLPATFSSATFYKNRTAAESALTVARLNLESTQNEVFSTRKKIEELVADKNSQLLELHSLKGQRTQIPSRHLKLREDLAQHLGIDCLTLPFVAELIRVIPEEKIWEATLEKVLFSFGLRLLVPTQFYSKVNRYFSKTNLHLKIVYHAVGVNEIFLQQKTEIKNSLFSKIEIKKNAKEFGEWIKQRILRDYNFQCADTLLEFEKLEMALTREGLVKRSGSYHEKDDRFGQGDRSRYILGWDNSEKLAGLQKQVMDLSSAEQKEQKLLKILSEKTASISARLEALLYFLNFDQFEKIDTSALCDEIKKLENSKKLLKGRSQNSLKVEERLKAARIDFEKQRQSSDQTLLELGLIRSEMCQLQSELKKCTAKENTEQREITTAFFKREKLKIDIDDLPGLETSLQLVSAKITDKNRTLNAKSSSLQTQLLRRMAQFKAQFPAHSKNLDASLEYVQAFCDLKESLEKESLPEHEKRFKTLLNKSLMSDMLAFKSTLELAYEDLQENISALNQALTNISYSDKTYVQIKVEKTKDIDVREFQNLLKNALTLKDKSTDAEFEESFNRIKKILDRLLLENRWKDKVTDIRHWGDFFITELFSDGSGQKNFYSDSSGLSGGQKAKLAFTILASAISHQFGLSETSAAEKSFRFVVIDEAFSKSDETNSKFAMELFKRLGLQLMVVTPKDKIHIVEPYVKNIFVTKMNDESNTSMLNNIKIKQFMHSSQHVETAVLN